MLLIMELTSSYTTTVGSEDSGCLFPSLPFDVTYDQSSGIDFKCDLNDNVAAPWPLSPHSSSNPSRSTCLRYFERLDRLVGPGVESNIGFVGWISYIYIFLFFAKRS
ncbi:putative uncharacterized GPI-anchored protein-lke [Helianthus annuus]|uniref:Uncharacterized GPI-anchored protein-lke n=1 Tax=Helianthus annuus TaxID=4232 RepID=A0A9K3NTN7_HELAN|nr:putative uncharacterized GPI-anchored protein-lke [Helianthus annuus]